MSEPTPSTWSALEGSSRRLTRSCGAGLVAYVAWTWALGYLVPAVVQRVGAEPPALGLQVGLAAAQYGWALVVLPALSWVLGRSIALEPRAHAFAAIVVGVALDLSLRSVIGADFSADDRSDLAFRALMLLVGFALTVSATRRANRVGGLRSARDSAVIAANQAAYAALTPPTASSPEQGASPASPAGPIDGSGGG